jgi:hypothetical protein
MGGFTDVETKRFEGRANFIRSDAGFSFNPGTVFGFTDMAGPGEKGFAAGVLEFQFQQFFVQIKADFLYHVV